MQLRFTFSPCSNTHRNNNSIASPILSLRNNCTQYLPVEGLAAVIRLLHSRESDSKLHKRRAPREKAIYNVVVTPPPTILHCTHIANLVYVGSQRTTLILLLLCWWTRQREKEPHMRPLITRVTFVYGQRPAGTHPYPPNGSNSEAFDARPEMTRWLQKLYIAKRGRRFVCVTVTDTEWTNECAEYGRNLFTL